MKSLSIFSILALATVATHAEELKVIPESIVLQGPRATQSILVVEMENGQVVHDWTKDAKFEPVDPKLVSAQENRLQVLAKQYLSTSINVSVKGQNLSVPVQLKGMGSPVAPSFKNDVQLVMTRFGCNSGACHGALAGKGGLKLSLRGYDDESDFFVLTRQAAARRIDLSKPEESLMLRKATAQIKHGGGTKFKADSVAYAMIRDWVQSGAKGPAATDAKIIKLEIFPTAARLKVKDQIRVVVSATYSDGTTRDVTDLAKFGSSEDQVATASDNEVTVMGHGEAAIYVNFQNQVAMMRIISPFPNVVKPELFAQSPRNNRIDEQILAKLQTLNIPPSPTCSDRDFIRRVYLDLAGILPTPDEVNKFVADSTKDKRDKLVDALLQRPEYVDYWSYKWSDLLLVSTRKLPTPAMWSFYRWVRQGVADNKPWDQFARELLTVSGSTLNQGAGNYFVLHKEISELTEATAVTFLGMSITCCRCHNHPLEKWTQDQYWSLANLFSRVAIKNGERNGEMIITQSPEGDVLHPRKGFAMKPTPLDAQAMSLESLDDRRAYFAQWLTGKENPYFAKAVVNRVWRNFMGRGLVEAEDDLRATNPPSNQALFDVLTTDFIESGYDMKKLIRQIATSAAYQRSSQAVPGNEADDRFYSRYILRRLSGEVMLDALSQATGSPTIFSQIYTGVEGGTANTGDYPKGTRAMQLPDSRVASSFLDSFGRPDRTATCSCERSQDSTVGQALLVNNGNTLNEKLRNSEGFIEKWLKEGVEDELAIQRVFQHALGREPTKDELKKLKMVFADAPKTNATARREAFEDLFWAILTTREFAFNH
jgi:hypothetical protein